MKTIVYPDGSIEATVHADSLVAQGEARYATPQEIKDYERAFERDDVRFAEYYEGFNPHAIRRGVLNHQFSSDIGGCSGNYR